MLDEYTTSDVQLGNAIDNGGGQMRIHDYHTASGKNLIKEYLKSLPKTEMYVGYKIRHKLGSQGISALTELDTRQLKGKLWEIKFSQNRIAYVAVDKENIHFLHIFKKQKGKTEKFDLDTAIQRADELGLGT